MHIHTIPCHAMPYNTIQKIQHTKQPHSVRGRIFCLLFASIECARSNAMRIHGLTWTLSRSPSHHHAVSFMWTQTSCHSVPVCVCVWTVVSVHHIADIFSRMHDHIQAHCMAQCGSSTPESRTREWILYWKFTYWHRSQPFLPYGDWLRVLLFCTENGRRLFVCVRMRICTMNAVR